MLFETWKNKMGVRKTNIIGLPETKQRSSSHPGLSYPQRGDAILVIALNLACNPRNSLQGEVTGQIWMPLGIGISNVSHPVIIIHSEADMPCNSWKLKRCVHIHSGIGNELNVRRGRVCKHKPDKSPDYTESSASKSQSLKINSAI